ncbi:MAG TPA: type VI secretion system lipoprotein TssJ [Gammaproteobacteria bacterium]|nr:type VI secretion system lipoprotein TssJ [Gammaproteobacteria bacterium]
MNVRAVLNRRPHAFAFLLAAAVLSAPALPAAAKETKLKSEVVAAEAINPNRHGAPQPVKIHIYYLAHDEGFRQASFGDLVAPNAPVLGGDLIRTADQLVGPGETLSLDEKFDEKTQFIGVVAEFTKIDQATWRAVAEVPAKKWTDALKLFSKSKFQIKVDGIAVSCGIVEE